MASPTAAATTTASPTTAATALSRSGGPLLVGPGMVASLIVLAASVGALVVLLRRGVS
jgi:small neutral amino acid transporter SnatA (MarC family)